MSKSKKRILESLASYIKEFGGPPASVYRFCKDSGISERDFFSQFGSFEAAESLFWSQMIDEVVRACSKGDEWAEFSAREKLLAFLFALTERSLTDRSLFLTRFKSGVWSRPPHLRGFELKFKELASGLVETGVASGEIAGRGRFAILYTEGLYLMLRGVIDFHLKDNSEGFQRTDAFIEKSVALAADLMRSQAVDSAIDLVRFLLPSACGHGKAA